MVLWKNKVHIPFKCRIPQRFDTPLVIFQVDAGTDDCSHKLIKVWVLDEKRPWRPFRMAYNSYIQARGQPWGEQQVIRVSTRLAKVLVLSPITTLRYP